MNEIIKKVGPIVEGFHIEGEEAIVWIETRIYEIIKSGNESPISNNDTVVQEVAKAFNVDQGYVKCRLRSGNRPICRFMCFAMKKMQGHSIGGIASDWNIGHAAVIHGLKTIMNRCDTEPIMLWRFNTVASTLGLEKEVKYLFNNKKYGR